MTSKLFLAAAVLSLSPCAFAETTSVLTGAQTMVTIMNMIPLEIRTNAFNGKTAQGESCRVDLVLTNSDPLMLALSVGIDDEKDLNMLVEKTNVVKKTHTDIGSGALVTLERTDKQAWKFSVLVPNLNEPTKRTVSLKVGDRSVDCAIDLDRNDN